MKKDKHIKVLFHLEQDEDGYPPFSIEGLWCKKASNDTYIVDNVPFYTYGISLGDEICVTEEDGEYHFQSIVNPSGNSTLRYILTINVCRWSETNYLIWDAR